MCVTDITNEVFCELQAGGGGQWDADSEEGWS